MKRCLRCGTKENITRDHVCSRVLLRTHLNRDSYQRFSAEARDVNIQPLCRNCNNEKGGDAVDYRGIEDRVALLLLLDKWGLDIEVKSGKPHDSVKHSIRYCQIHGEYGSHRTDDCLLLKNVPKLIEYVTEFVKTRDTVEEHLKAFE